MEIALCNEVIKKKTLYKYAYWMLTLTARFAKNAQRNARKRTLDLLV